MTGALQLVVTGTPAGTETFKVQITDDTAPNTFAYSKSGAAWVTGVTVTGASQQLGSEGVYLTFGSTFGHALRAEWIITVADNTATLTSSPTVREHDPCSGRGLCDMSQGTCTCFTGYTGVACRNFTWQEVLPPSPVKKAKHLYVGKLNYTGDVVKLENWHHYNDSYFVIRGITNGFDTFTVDGAGRVRRSASLQCHRHPCPPLTPLLLLPALR